MATVITVAIEKGGAGKTTTVVNLAALLAAQGKKVLVVDVDKQANTTAQLTGFDEYEGTFAGKSIFDAIRCYDADPGKYIVDSKVENLRVLPANRDVELIPMIESVFESQRRGGKYEYLARCLAQTADEYDYVVIDTPPSNPDLTRNALLASDYVIIPLNPTQSNVSGLFGIYNLCQEINTRYGGCVRIAGILLTRVRSNLNLVKAMRQQIIDSDWGKDLFNSEIREGAAVQESESFYQPLVQYARSSRPAEDYRAFFDELMSRIDAMEQEEA